MLKIYENIPSFDRSMPLKAWLFRIARNRCIDHLRSRKDQDALDENIPGNEEQAVENILNDELSSAVRKSLALLDPDDSQIAYLHFFENMRYRRISEIMSINVNTIKTRIAAIKRRLRADLEGWL